MYVTLTVYKNSDIKYSTILMPRLSEKVAILYSMGGFLATKIDSNVH